MDIVKECKKQYKNQIRKENCCHDYYYSGWFENISHKICEIFICRKCRNVVIKERNSIDGVYDKNDKIEVIE